MSQQIVLASNNAGKLREIQSLLAPLAAQLLTQTSLGITETAEPHSTFIENCITKARHAARLAGLPALADDSGLCVTALNGAPGVHSARYANECSASTRDQRNNTQLIANLQGIADRRAYYYCVMVYLRHADDPQPLIAEGIWHGLIVDEARGADGFGYDPHFQVPDLQRTAAELTLAEKNLLSHRAQALTQLLARMRMP